MNSVMGVAQSRLRRVECVWGGHSRKFHSLIPIFHSDYKVPGLVGISPEGESVWFPGPPLTVEPGRLTFKSSFTDEPPQWSDLDRNLFDGAFYHDGLGALPLLLANARGAPSPDNAVNLAGARLKGRKIQDILFEPHLHRVRAFLLRGRFFRPQPISVMSMPALTEMLEVPLRHANAIPAQQIQPMSQSGLMQRIQRKALKADVSTPPEKT